MTVAFSIAMTLISYALKKMNKYGHWSIFKWAHKMRPIFFNFGHLKVHIIALPCGIKIIIIEYKLPWISSLFHKNYAPQFTNRNLQLKYSVFDYSRVILSIFRVSLNLCHALYLSPLSLLRLLLTLLPSPAKIQQKMAHKG